MKAPVAGDLVAYSVLTRLTDGVAGCLFEAGHYARIVFAGFPVEA